MSEPSNKSDLEALKGVLDNLNGQARVIPSKVRGASFIITKMIKNHSPDLAEAGKILVNAGESIDGSALSIPSDINIMKDTGSAALLMLADMANEAVRLQATNMERMVDVVDTSPNHTVVQTKTQSWTNTVNSPLTHSGDGLPKL